jgi:hypothetical protein
MDSREGVVLGEELTSPAVRSFQCAQDLGFVLVVYMTVGRWFSQYVINREQFRQCV